MTIKPTPTTSLDDLQLLMARLRQDCPWDKKQTNDSLIPYAIEEVYELVEAIQENDIEEIKAELGDVLLQVVFHAHLYQEQGLFDMGDVIFQLQEKLIRRHPHVFDKETLTTEEAVKQRWDEIKAYENQLKQQGSKQAAQRSASRLNRVKAGSALMQAQSLQQEASKLGFDWDDIEPVMAKVQEELAELQAILPTDDTTVSQEHKKALEKELGDCFFALVNVARKLKIDSEKATLTSVHKFRHRFAYIEAELEKLGKTPETASLAEMDALWEQAKQYE